MDAARGGAPCLVEVGARCHGAEGFWCSIADEALGYNQASVALEAFVDAAAFAARPAACAEASRRAEARLKYLLVHRVGTLAAVSGEALAEVGAMASYRGHEVFVVPGQALTPTIDCFSWAGVVKLAHADPAVVEADYARIEALCLSGLWEWAGAE